MARSNMIPAIAPMTGALTMVVDQPRVVFKVEASPVEVMRTEGMELLEQHREEVAQYPEICALDPDWPIYETLEKFGRLVVVSARDQGRLIGYAVMFLTRNLHYRSVTMATEDIHFLHPDYRKGLTGYRMIVFTEMAVKLLGARICSWRTKARHDHGKLFEHAGYELEDKVYTRILED